MKARTLQGRFQPSSTTRASLTNSMYGVTICAMTGRHGGRCCHITWDRDSKAIRCWLFASKKQVTSLSLLRKVGKIRRSQVLKAIDLVNSFTFERCEVTHPLFGVDSNVNVFVSYILVSYIFVSYILVSCATSFVKQSNQNNCRCSGNYIGM